MMSACDCAVATSVAKDTPETMREETLNTVTNKMGMKNSNAMMASKNLPIALLG